MKFNYKHYIEQLGGVLVEEDTKYICCKYMNFKFKVYKTTIRNGNFYFEGNFRACLDKTDYFKYYMKQHCQHENIIFDNSKFAGMRDHVTVTCKEHGSFKTTPEQLINRNSGCSKCYNKYYKSSVRNKGLDVFVEQANSRFDSKFDYSETVYKNTMTKVKIKCLEHGAFYQTPNEHLQSTYACPSCYSIYNSFKIEDYDKMCPEGSYLYVVKLSNTIEMFYKIGISKNPDKRFKTYKRSGFTIGENIILFNKDAGLIFSLEDDLLANHNFLKYTPKTDFKGKTECFYHVDIEDVQDMFYTITKLSY